MREVETGRVDHGSHGTAERAPREVTHPVAATLAATRDYDAAL